MNAELADNPFKGLAEAALQSFQLQWGWAILLIGSLMLIVAALMKEDNIFALSQNKLNPLNLDKHFSDPKPFALTRKMPNTATDKIHEAMPDNSLAVSEPEDSASSWNDKGRRYSLSSNYDQTINAYSKAIELNPGHSIAYFNREIAHKRLGNQKSARKDFKAAADLGHKTAQGIVKGKKISWANK